MCGVAAAALTLPGMALAHTETARLTIHSTVRSGAVTVHDGSSAAIDGASVKLTLGADRGATFAVTSADGKTLYTLGVPSFLRTGGTWMLAGSVLGSGAQTVALAIYPEGPGAGQPSARNKSSDYARIVLFNVKHDRTSGTLSLSRAPLAVGHTTFGVTQFFSGDRCQVSVSGPQFKPSKRFGLVPGAQGNVIASPNGKQAFIVVASNFRG